MCVTACASVIVCLYMTLTVCISARTRIKWKSCNAWVSVCILMYWYIFFIGVCRVDLYLGQRSLPLLSHFYFPVSYFLCLSDPLKLNATLHRYTVLSTYPCLALIKMGFLGLIYTVTLLEIIKSQPVNLTGTFLLVFQLTEAEWSILL